MLLRSVKRPGIKVMNKKVVLLSNHHNCLSKISAVSIAAAVRSAAAGGGRLTKPATEHPHDGALLHQPQVCQQSQLQASSHREATDGCYQRLRQLQAGRTLEQNNRLVHQSTHKQTLLTLLPVENIHCKVYFNHLYIYIWRHVFFCLMLLDLSDFHGLYTKKISRFQTVKQRSNKWSEFWLLLNKWSPVYSEGSSAIIFCTGGPLHPKDFTRNQGCSFCSLQEIYYTIILICCQVIAVCWRWGLSAHTQL